MSRRPTDSNKRKSDASQSASSSKKPRIVKDEHRNAKRIVQAILLNPDEYEIPSDDDTTRQNLVEVARYVQSLEDQIQSREDADSDSDGDSRPLPKSKTKEQIASEAARVEAAAKKGIKSQMKWKPSCKQRSAKWSYDGICTDADVFGALLNLDGPPKFKAKKISLNDFENVFGSIIAPIRYGELRITSSDINVRWNATTGEFKLSGYYGL